MRVNSEIHSVDKATHFHQKNHYLHAVPQKGNQYIIPVSYTHLDVYKRQPAYMMVKRPLYYFLNVSNFFNYLTAIFLLSPRTDIGCENYNKTPLKRCV